jgi:hypothetical protein
MEPVVLDTPTFIPGDYRTPQEIMEESARQIEEGGLNQNDRQANT